MSEVNGKDFVLEKSPEGSYLFGFGLKKKLFEKQSQFQKVEVYDTVHHGKVLLHDGFFMLSERDEAIYHEMISHVPMFVHGAAKKVLVIGGGDGGTAREILRHPGVESCTMVEIDGVVVDVCKEFFPQVAESFSNPKLNLIIDDGVAFMKNTQEKFDVIVIDSTDPIGPATPLFGEDFYADVFRCLNEEGIVVAQGESPFYSLEMQQKLLSMNFKKFQWTSMYNFSNLTYPGGLWSFFFASKKKHPILDFRSEGMEKLPPRSNMDLPFHYYNSEVHKACFSLPEFQRSRLASWISI